MPPSSFIIPFFIMLGGGPMSVRGKFVLFGGFAVCIMHGVSTRCMWKPNPPVQGQNGLIARDRDSMTKPGHLTLDGRRARARIALWSGGYCADGRSVPFLL
jgi:hypothetical protein